MPRGVCPECGSLVAISPGGRIAPPPGAALPTSARLWVIAMHPDPVLEQVHGEGISQLTRCDGSGARI